MDIVDIVAILSLCLGTSLGHHQTSHQNSLAYQNDICHTNETGLENV